jgi:subtilisin family serine protease
MAMWTYRLLDPVLYRLLLAYLALARLARWALPLVSAAGLLALSVQHAAAQPEPQQGQHRAVPGRDYDKESVSLVRAPEAQRAGFTGAGTAVAVLDTGVDYRRAAFGPCTGPNSPERVCKVAVATSVANGPGQLDPNGHGTNVAGIVLGVAPETRLIVLDVFDGDRTSTAHVLAALDWVLKHKQEYNIVAVNLSLGSEAHLVSPCRFSPYTFVFRDLRQAGVLPIVSAGNSGAVGGRFVNGVASPACVPGAVSVGAVYDGRQGPRVFPGECVDRSPRPDQVTCWSQSGPTLSLWAPGSRITAAGLTKEGTSQAAPHVAGAVAALASKCPTATPADIERALTTTGPTVKDPRNGLERHRLDVMAAGQALVARGLCR